MKIDIVLTACNLNKYYLNLYPYVYKVWKEKFDLDLYMVLISDEIPENLKTYEKFIILFKPIDNINSCYIAQVIRILYPCLFENLNVLITDIDIIPISSKYFFNSIEKYSNDKFISYTDRYIQNKMMAICYNVANSYTWKKIFNINNINDIIDILIKNYTDEYTDKKNSKGWYTDQKLLFNYVSEYQNIDSSSIIILKDEQIGYKRLDGKSTNKLNEIKTNQKNIVETINTFSDFHIIRNYHINMELLENIIENILTN